MPAAQIGDMLRRAQAEDYRQGVLIAREDSSGRPDIWLLEDDISVWSGPFTSTEDTPHNP